MVEKALQALQVCGAENDQKHELELVGGRQMQYAATWSIQWLVSASVISFPRNSLPWQIKGSDLVRL